MIFTHIIGKKSTLDIPRAKNDYLIKFNLTKM